MSMESKQKYTEGKKKGRKIILSSVFFEKLEQEYEGVAKKIFDHLDTMTNDLHGHQSLGLTFNDNDGDAVFIVFYFLELSDLEIRLYDYDHVSSDVYLDLLLTNDLIQQCKHIIY